MRSREGDGGTAAVGDAEHHRCLRSGGIHHGGQIGHPLVHARQRVGRIGQAGAALVKTDHPARLLQRGHEPAVAQLLPLQIQVRHQARHEHQVTRAFTGDLKSDLGASRLSIPSWRHTASHPDMIHHRGGRHQTQALTAVHYWSSPPRRGQLAMPMTCLIVSGWPSTRST